MDENQISFEALFNSGKFIYYTSPKCEQAYDSFDRLIAAKVSDTDLRNEIDSESGRCRTAAQESGFMQGFCFAVKIMNFLGKISDQNSNN